MPKYVVSEEYVYEVDAETPEEAVQQIETGQAAAGVLISYTLSAEEVED